MPCRLIREDLLDSERVLSLPIEARWLYVTILLSADDLGLFEATSFKLARRSDIRREAGDQLLSMLADADLVRLYEVGGKRFGFIPRFRQRIQIKFLKHPVPPEQLMSDDLDALNKIRHLIAKPTVGKRMGIGCSSAGQLSEAKAKAKAKEEKSKDVSRATRMTHDMKLPDDWLQWCQSNRADLDPVVTFAAFRDYWIARPGAGGCKLDWFATWRNWVRTQRSNVGRKAPGKFADIDYGETGAI